MMNKWCDKAVDELQDKSMVIAMEELAELQQAISKGIRGKLDYDNLCEEIADVIIVTEWIKYRFDVKQQDIEKWLDHKQCRIADRLSAGILD